MKGDKIKSGTRRYVSPQSDSESDYDSDAPVARFKSARKTTTKKKNYIEDSDTDQSSKNELESRLPLVTSEKKKKRSSTSNGSNKDRLRPDQIPSSSKMKIGQIDSKSKTSKRPRKESSGKKEITRNSPKRSKPDPISSSSVSNVAPKKMKEMDKVERLLRGMQAYQWWEGKDPPDGYQWLKMEHNGVSFPEPYIPHNVKMKYDGEVVTLTPAQEEAATFFAGMDPEGMHLGNPKVAPTFIKNFFNDFKQLLGNKHIIKKFEKCDFSPIRKHLEQQKIIKKAISDTQKKINKEERNEAMFRYGFAIVDDHLEKVGNYNMEPPGTFRGRGEHPKAGKLKQRVNPEQVALNLSECARVPPCSVPGHAWGELKHDPQVQWLGNWRENINNQAKYMQLAAQSSFKGKSDRMKYNKAALLCENIDKIRADYKRNLKSKSNETRQLATAMWVIDRLALRVGGEKDTDEEADTVGCCSLRVEHLHFNPNNDDDDNLEIELEFLGKDSMLYKQTIDFGASMYTENNGMGDQVFKNLASFCKKKSQTEDVFDSLTPTILNNHLKSIMNGLTAKVFRTYNASKTLQDELKKHDESPSFHKLSPSEKIVEYNNANRQVAILCNHQRSVSKAQETQLENIGAKLKMLNTQKKELKGILKTLLKNEKGDSVKIPLKKNDKEITEKAQDAVARAKKLKESAKTDEEKIKASKADEKAKQMRKEASEMKFTQNHLWEKVPTVEQVQKKIETWTAKITKMELDLKHRDDNKEVSLGTSKMNYMDPRISVAWCKRNEVPIEKVFSKTLRDKFNWAMAVPPDWEFNASIGK